MEDCTKVETKRARSSNFSAEEEETLLKCILRRQNVIENKKTDALSTNAKNLAWEKILKDFNSRCPNVVERSAKALRDKYTNLKTLLRKQYAAEKARRKAMGDGNKGMAEWQPKTEALAELAHILALSSSGTATDCDGDNDDFNYLITKYQTQTPNTLAVRTEGLYNINQIKTEDSLGLEGADIDGNDAMQTFEEKAVVNDSSVASSSSSAKISTCRPTSKTDWPNKYTPEMIRQPLVRTVFKRPSSSASSCTDDNVESFQLLKKKMIERDMEMREEEHDARMAQQKAEHVGRMALLNLQQAELREKSELRQMKIKIFKRKINKKAAKSSDTESDF